MSNNLNEEINELLRKLNLSNYEINILLALSNVNFLPARVISKKSTVPSGRIYEILDALNEKGLIEIQESRPKKFRVIPLNQIFNKLISNKDKGFQHEITFLFNLARNLESKLYDSNIFQPPESSKIFWRTAFGSRSIFSMYINYINESQDEILFTGFLNENTLKVLPLGRKFYKSIILAINRGVNVKFLWSFDHDERILSEEQKKEDLNVFSQLITLYKERFNMNPEKMNFEVKFVFKKMASYFDIIDN
ncbi:MAG TPA: helix-turn-helix domain-containing protein, partial [Candidatus Lokiarchaeia archaeon]